MLKDVLKDVLKDELKDVLKDGCRSIHSELLTKTLSVSDALSLFLLLSLTRTHRDAAAAIIEQLASQKRSLSPTHSLSRSFSLTHTGMEVEAFGEGRHTDAHTHERESIVCVCIGV